MSARDTAPTDRALDRVTFLARHRFPRPVAVSVARAFTEHRPEAVRLATRRCALRTLRFLAAVRYAGQWATSDTPPDGPPEPDALRWGFPADYFLSELAGERAADGLLALADTLPDEHTVHSAPQPAPDPASMRRRLLEALAPLTALADYRLLVPGPAEPELPGAPTLLLGTHLRYAGPLPGDPTLPDDAPALFSPRSGRLLSLAPLLRWEPGPLPGQGSLFLLREHTDDGGVYAEVDREQARRLRRPLEGRPTLVTGAAPMPAEIADALPPLRFRDGDHLASDHDVRGLMWRGPDADIYAALRAQDGTPVALKTPRPDADEAQQQRFAVEMAVGQKARHARLIDYRPVAGAGEPGLVEMDHMPGGSLADRLLREGVLDPVETLALLEPLCEGLTALHHAGVVHLDLQPDNLQLTADGELRLGDYRNAVDLDDQATTRRAPTHAGLPMYLPPERRSGQHVDPRADLWQLGVLLSLLLVGERPQAPSSVARPPRLPRVLGDVIRRLLEPNPTDRYGSAAEVVDAFRAATRQLSPLRCVALDLEGTLLTTSYDPLPRPHLAEFAQWCLDTFDRIFVYTAVDERSARVILARFVRAGVLPAPFPQRAELVDWPRGRGGALKDLRLLRLPLHWVVLLDDMREWVVEDQRHRWVPIPCFEATSQNDEVLRTIQPEILARF